MSFLSTSLATRLIGLPLALGSFLAASFQPALGLSHPNRPSTSSLQDLEARLSELGAPDLATRAAAELRLARELGAADGGRTAQLLARADLETRARLIGAAGRSRFGLDLAFAWLADQLPSPDSPAQSQAAARTREAARAVFDARLEAWLPGLDSPMEDGQRVLRAFEQLTRGERLRFFEVDLADGPRAAVQALLFGSNFEFGVVLDPRIDRDLVPSSGRGAVRISGTYDDLLEGLAKRYGLELDLASADPERELEPRRPVFVRLTDPTFAGQETAREALWSWFRALAEGGATDRFAAANSLASTGWPEVIEWLARLGELEATDSGRAALEGARLACERGRVPVAWVSPEGVLELLSRADDLAESGDLEGADGWLRALMRFPRRDAAGSDLLLSLLRGADPERPNRCSTRLAVAAEWRVHSEALEDLAVRLLEDPGSPGILARAALRARAASASTGAELRPVLLADPLLLLADLRRSEPALLRAAQLRAARVLFPPGFVPPSGWPGPGRGAFLLAIDETQAGTELAAAAENESSWLALEETLRRGLVARRLGGELQAVRTLFERASAASAGGEGRERLDLLALAVGAASPVTAGRLAPDLLNDPESPPHLLAALVGYQAHANNAQAQLLGRWMAVLSDEREGAPATGRSELVTALADAYRLYLAQGDDRAAIDLRRGILIGLSQGPAPGWADPILSGFWPLPAGLEAQDPWPAFPRSDPAAQVVPGTNR